MGLLSGGALNELLRVLRKAKNEHSLSKAMRETEMRLRRDAGGEAVGNCPSLAHSLRSPSLKIDLSDPDHFWCTACGAWGDVFDFMGLVHGAARLAKQYELLTGLTLESQVDPRYAAEIGRVAERQRREAIEESVAPDEVCDFTYRALLGLLALYDPNYEWLIERGATDEDCGWRGYRSLQLSTRVRVDICTSLIANGCQLESVPGFFRLPENFTDEGLRGHWCVGVNQWGSDQVALGEVSHAHEAGGLLIPVRDAQKRIVRLTLQGSPLPSSASEDLIENRPPRAAALSLGQCLVSKSGGAAGGARLHHAFPVDHGRHYRVLWIVEGALNADIISGRLNAHVVGVPGFGQLTDELRDVMGGYREVRIALNDYGNAYTENLYYEAGAAGAEVCIVRWDCEGGGKVEDILVEEEADWWLEPDPFN